MSDYAYDDDLQAAQWVRAFETPELWYGTDKGAISDSFSGVASVLLTDSVPCPWRDKALTHLLESRTMALLAVDWENAGDVHEPSGVEDEPAEETGP